MPTSSRKRQSLLGRLSSWSRPRFHASSASFGDEKHVPETAEAVSQTPASSDYRSWNADVITGSSTPPKSTGAAQYPSIIGPNASVPPVFLPVKRVSPASQSFLDLSDGRFRFLEPFQMALRLLEDRHCYLQSRLVPGTGRWLLDSVEFKYWLNAEAKFKALRCLGDPGIGKTFLAYASPFLLQFVKVIVLLAVIQFHSSVNLKLRRPNSLLPTYTARRSKATSNLLVHYSCSCFAVFRRSTI